MTLELWQTEWCPASHRVRQRLTELELSFTAHQVPVAPETRAALRAATGATSIPVLVANGQIVGGEAAIVAFLDDHYSEPPGADAQRRKATKAKHKELEDACRTLATATR
jgi:glutathione S-transferase